MQLGVCVCLCVCAHVLLDVVIRPTGWLMLASVAANWRGGILGLPLRSNTAQSSQPSKLHTKSSHVLLARIVCLCSSHTHTQFNTHTLACTYVDAHNKTRPRASHEYTKPTQACDTTEYHGVSASTSDDDDRGGSGGGLSQPLPVLGAVPGSVPGGSRAHKEGLCSPRACCTEPEYCPPSAPQTTPIVLVF